MSLFNHSFQLRHLYGPAISVCSDHQPVSAMAKGRPSPEFLDQLSQQLDRCWRNDCDIDHLILRARQLRRLGRWRLARCLDQEVLPIVLTSQSASAWLITRRSTSIRASSAAPRAVWKSPLAVSSNC